MGGRSGLKGHRGWDCTAATIAQGCTHTSTGVSIHTGTFVHFTHQCDDMMLVLLYVVLWWEEGGARGVECSSMYGTVEHLVLM